jgi:hypothetical protein
MRSGARLDADQTWFLQLTGLPVPLRLVTAIRV